MKRRKKMQTKKKLLSNLRILESDILGSPMKIEMKNLSLFVGQNGSGKTIVLIQTWIINYITATYIASPQSLSALTQGLQFIMDHSFDINDFTGKIRGEFDELDVEFTLDKGKVDNLLFTCKGCDIKDLESPGMPVYMSTNTRLFSDVIKYLKMKKLMGLADIKTFNDSDLKKLCEVYKIYDIMFIERMMARIGDPFFKILDMAQEKLKEMTGKDIKHVFYDDKTCEIHVTEVKNGISENYLITKLSNGEQALINMHIQY